MRSLIAALLVAVALAFSFADVAQAGGGALPLTPCNGGEFGC